MIVRSSLFLSLLTVISGVVEGAMKPGDKIDWAGGLTEPQWWHDQKDILHFQLRK